MLCFFQDAIATVVADGAATKVIDLQSEMGPAADVRVRRIGSSPHAGAPRARRTDGSGHHGVTEVSRCAIAAWASRTSAFDSANVLQRVALQVQRLGAVRLRDAGGADQHVS